MNTPLITVVGGSGFIGRYIVRALCQKGYRVRVLCRDAIKGEFLKTAGNVGQVAIQHLDITKKASIAGALHGSDGVIYLPGLLYQSGKQRFQRIHEIAAADIATEAADAGARAFVYMSALGVNDNRSIYARTKHAGEAAVMEAFPSATILRPSLVIGQEDGFFQRFARMASISPALPLIGGGRTLFQPVYVQDVADAAVAALESPNAQGAIYELAGPETYSFRELLEMMCSTIRTNVTLLSIPKPLAMIMGLLNELLPTAPQITRDQVRSLATNNVTSGEQPGLKDLGITPTHIQSLLPTLLKRYVRK